jgi:Sec-independent protein secretion pathway component TatC
MGAMYAPTGSDSKVLAIAVMIGMLLLPICAVSGIVAANKAMYDFTQERLILAYLLPSAWLAYMGAVALLL